MDKEIIMGKVREVRNAPSCYEGLKKLCDEYLKAVGTAEEEKAGEALKAALKEDVCSIDQVIPFFDSPEGARVLGEDTAKQLTLAAREAKEKGVKYCICPACTAGGWLLDHEKEF